MQQPVVPPLAFPTYNLRCYCQHTPLRTHVKLLVEQGRANITAVGLLTPFCHLPYL
jgi:hypothetical protein